MVSNSNLIVKRFNRAYGFAGPRAEVGLACKYRSFQSVNINLINERIKHSLDIQFDIQSDIQSDIQMTEIEVKST